MLALWAIACHRTGDSVGSTGSTGEDGGSSDVRLLDDDHVLVVPSSDGLKLLRSDGTAAFDRSWTELVGSCDACVGLGSSADGDGLLVAFTTNGPTGGGGIARLDATAALDWRLDGFQFPHDAVRDPADQAIIVPEAFGDRIRWIAGDGSSATPIRGLQDGGPDWPGDVPNGIDRFESGGRDYLVVSHRGSTGGFDGKGEITLWDITDPASLSLVWTFPPEGTVNTPHGAVLREYGGRWWLFYAHTFGRGPNDGTIGLAVTDDPATLPAYVADLVPPASLGPLVYARAAELTDDGTLWIIDSGSFKGATGRLISAEMPDLEPTGASGATGGGQVFVDLDGASVVVGGLADPFEGWLWKPTFSL